MEVFLAIDIEAIRRVPLQAGRQEREAEQEDEKRPADLEGGLDNAARRSTARKPLRYRCRVMRVIMATSE